MHTNTVRGRPASRGASTTSRPELVEELLVVTNETLAGESMIETVAGLVVPRAHVFIVCPALVGRFRLWRSDITAAMVAARYRLEASVEGMRALGLRAEGMIGDTDPILAIEDALRVTPAQRVLICTHPNARSTRRERRLVPRARARFPIPVSHTIVDLASDAGLASLERGAGARDVVRGNQAAGFPGA